MRKIICLLTAAVLLLSTIPAALAADAAEDTKATLVDEITKTAVSYVSTSDGDLYMYKDMNWTSIADTLPAKLDLRDRGVVPEIRNQKNWGTCWGFASIAGSEISILSSLGITTEKYAELVGSDLNLSERHLAWFGTGHLPTLDQYPEGEYPYPESQAGEGEWHSNEETEPSKAHYSVGGNMAYAAGIFANGMGPVTEEMYPYTANDGSESTSADWTIDESARYCMIAELVNSCILPSPSLRDADGNYYYNPAGTEAIKKELLAGRAVTIAYHADQALSPEAVLEMNIAAMMSYGADRETAEIFARVALGYTNPYELTAQERVTFMKGVLIVSGETVDSYTQEELEQLAEANFDGIAQAMLNQQEAKNNPEDADEIDFSVPAELEEQIRSAAEKLGMDYDQYISDYAKMSIAAKGEYINTETYAQYTDNQYAPVSHAVTIIGWDDNYAIENFPADHQPPETGAWIVRNSWGPDYGNDGYFYLSYYDQTLIAPETFEYVFDKNAYEGGVKIESYDQMQASAVSSAQQEAPVYSANIFPVDEECVLNYVSVMTADLNTKATVAVYLLNENYTSPVDGVLLDTATATLEFGGYHRIELNHAYQLPAGCVISVVQKQATKTTAGLRYTLPFTNAASEEASTYSKMMDPDAQNPNISWYVGCIGEGESFICVDNTWYDWKDIVDEVREGNHVAALVEFDNMNIKAYFYTVGGVYAAHKFGPEQAYMNAQALICEECGDTLIVVK